MTLTTNNDKAKSVKGPLRTIQYRLPYSWQLPGRTSLDFQRDIVAILEEALEVVRADDQVIVTDHDPSFVSKPGNPKNDPSNSSSNLGK
jgi:hypothetical protein